METRTLDIPLLLPSRYEDCERCLDRLKEALQSLDGVHHVKLDASASTVTLTYDSTYVSMERIEQEARSIGVRIAEQYAHESITITGLDCPDCALKIEKAIMRIPGVLWASVNYATSILSAEYEVARADLSLLVRCVEKLGYGVAGEPPTARPAAPYAEARPAWKNPRVLLTMASGILLAAGFSAHMLEITELSVLLYGLSIVMGGYYPARSGIFGLRSLTVDTNLLMSLAAAGAVLLQDYFEAGMVLFLFSLGSALEAHTVEKTRRSIRSLLDLSPGYALVRRDGKESLLPVEEIQVGDTIIVKPGEKIPMDGIVTSGSSSVNQAPITGESMAVEKEPGSAVFAGTINGHGALEITVTRLVGDNTISRIIHLVEEAQAQKAPSQRFSERFGRIYTPLVICTAVLIALLPPIFGAHFVPWFRRALILLVVSCPCALVISTPVAIVAAIGNAARNGVLIKGGSYLEALGRVSIVAFDKTGTLTTGRLEVTDVVPLDSMSRRELLAIAAAVESRSEHPLADAICRRARLEGTPAADISYFEAIPGQGARAIVDGRVFYVGNRRLLERLKLDHSNPEEAQVLHSAGKTLVYVADERSVLGVIAAADTLKESSVKAVQELRRAGIGRIIMLTGDSATTAETIARSAGVEEYRAELLPEEKVEFIQQLIRQRERVAMVGDGINDAPALAAATVGIAMGGAGSHAALETADLVLTADDLSMLPYGVRLSRRSLQIIRENVGFSLLVVITLIASTLMGKLTLTGGVLGHEASALLVIANSMRLLSYRSA